MRKIAMIVMLLGLSLSAVAEDAVEIAEKQYKASVDQAKTVLAAAQKVYDDKVKAAKEVLAVKLKAEIAAKTRAGDLDGALKIKARLEEASQVSQDTAAKKPNQIVHENDVDYNNLTAEFWDSVPVSPIKVDASSKSVDAKMELGIGERVIIIPHPDDKWKANPTGEPSDFRGFNEAPNGMPWMQLCFKIGPGKMQKYGVAEGPGKLTLMANDTGYGDNSGSIRVKIVKISK